MTLPPICFYTLNKLRQSIFFALDTPDVWNPSMTKVTLLFTQVRDFTVNNKHMAWKYQAYYIWESILWYTYFHWVSRQILKNKRNMVLESVGVLFIF